MGYINRAMATRTGEHAVGAKRTGIRPGQANVKAEEAPAATLEPGQMEDGSSSEGVSTGSVTAVDQESGGTETETEDQ